MNRREAIAALMSLPAVKTISVAKLAPNDVIVIEAEQHLHPEMVARIEATLKTVWPDHKAVVVDSRMKLRIVQAGQA